MEYRTNRDEIMKTVTNPGPPCETPNFCQCCQDLAKSKLKPLQNSDFMLSKFCKKDFGVTVKKIAELVSDPVANVNGIRIRYYLDELLNIIVAENEDGFYVKDLESVMTIIDFLSLRSRDAVEYEIYLDRMLDLCRTPPRLMKTSEALISLPIIEHYFTFFAYLLVILPTVRQVMIVHEAIRRLLDRTKPGDVAAVKLQLCHRAVETSVLPVVVTEILEITIDEVFERMLRTTLLIVSVSQECCCKMTKAGLFENLIIRLDPNYLTRKPHEPPEEIPEDQLDGRNDDFQILLLVTDIMWKILHTVTQDFSDFKPPSQFAMWSLRYAFRREVRCAGRNQNSSTMRNDLAAIMLAILSKIPAGWKFVESGLAEDLIVLAVANEIGSKETWASNVRLGNSNDDFRFKKILILIVCHLAKIGACHEIIKRRGVLSGFLCLVNPDTKDINLSRDDSQFWDLHRCALHAVAILLPIMPEHFIRSKGTNRLITIIEWTMTNEFDSPLILNCVTTVNSIVTNGGEIIRKDFRVHGAVGTIIKLVNFVLSVDTIDSQHQRILTHAMMILEDLMIDEKRYQTMYGEQGVAIVLKILHRWLYDKKGYLQLDNRALRFRYRLAIALGTYMWRCIVRCPSVLNIFVERGSIFTILDVIDATTVFHVRVIFLGILCDICEDGKCESQLSTWRGKNKELGLMSLLAKIWREEEDRIKVKRTKEGCIEDLELPLMGEEQWFATYYSNRDHTRSPSLMEIFASCRPKICGIKKILKRNSVRYELAKDHYKILLHEIPTEDRITMLLIDRYFRLKQGEIWFEIHREIQQIGVVPLRIDGEMISLMLQRHHNRSLFIKSSQEAILNAAKAAQLREEKATYKEIMDSKLAPSLKAYHEIDYLARTSDSKFMRRSKQKQVKQVERALSFPKNSQPEFCHRTFLGKTNVTAIMDHRHVIPGEADVNFEFGDYNKLMPVSPSTTNSTTSISLINAEAGDAKSCRTCFITGLPCFHR